MSLIEEYSLQIQSLQKEVCGRTKLNFTIPEIKENEDNDIGNLDINVDELYHKIIQYKSMVSDFNTNIKSLGLIRSLQSNKEIEMENNINQKENQITYLEKIAQRREVDLQAQIKENKKLCDDLKEAKKPFF